MIFRSRFWRKKSVLLGLLILATTFLCFHFTTLGRKRDSILNGDQSGGSINRKFKYYPTVQPNDPLRQSAQVQKSEEKKEAEEQEDFEGVRFLDQKTAAHKLALSEAEKIILRTKNKEFFSRDSLNNRKIADKYRYVSPQISPNINSNLEYDVPPPIYYGSSRKNESAEAEEEVLYVPTHRLVHFDLKGAPPSIPFFLQLLQMSKDLGATGILLEYEDMFPFEGRLSVASAYNHYTKDDLKTILSTCSSLGLIVIPLIQTFGHMEFILKLKEFAYLRDVSEMPESICPCHRDTMGLIKEMADQVVRFHKEFDPKFQYLHIGCDEVFHLGECEPCKDMKMSGRRNEIFTQHVINVASYIKDNFGVMPIIWDDMLRNFMSEEMSPLAGLVEPMVWVYAEEVYRFVPTYTWDKLAEVFDSVWTASAFKGAHGSTLVVPNVKRHLDNNLNWIDLMKNEEKKFKQKLRGIVITGWQRYDHFAILCELLPSAVPSLAVSLLATTNGYFNSSLTSQLFKALQCSSTSPQSLRRMGSSDPNELNLEDDPFLFNQLSWCFFSGSNFFKVLPNLLSTKKEVADFIKKVTKDHAWTTEYGMRRNYTSPFRIDEVMGDWERVYYEIERLMKSAKYALMDIFDVYTQSEWIEQNIYPLILQMKEIKEKTSALKVRRFWNPRPLPPLTALQTEFGIGLKSNSSKTQTVLGGGDRLGRRSYYSDITGRPKRLVQQPDYYRHPPGYQRK